MLALALLLASPAAHAWGQHYLLTDRALDTQTLAWLDTPVEVESMEALLADAGPVLAQAIRDHYSWLADRGSERFKPQTLPESGATRADFWRATRLNPLAHLPLLARDLPGATQPLGAFSIAPESASPYLHQAGGLLVQLSVTRSGQRIPARAVLRTFVDEPDWGMDHELWAYTEYGYGTQPYGKALGESSKAPFHMQFDHENFLTVAFSDAEEGMVRDRIDLFSRLSKAAFAADHDYWGLRFAAWTTHYAQDLAQPYHSKAIPGVGFGWYIGYVLSSHKDEITDHITRIEANRHFVYEDYVATALQGFYTENDPLSQTLAQGLADDGDDFTDVQDTESLVQTLTATAAQHARVIDAALVAAFPTDLMNNADYDVETAPDYDIQALLPKVPADAGQALLDETGEDFQQAGRATRTVLRLVGAQAALEP